MGHHLLFDIECDNLLDKVTVVHCAVVADLHTGEIRRFGPGEVERHLLPLLAGASLLAGHNIAEYDLPVLERLYGFVYTGDVLDTKCASRQVYPGYELEARDFRLHARGALDAGMIGLHSLAAWGQRLKCPKAPSPESYEVYTPATLDYCEQDVKVNLKLLEHLRSKGTPDSVWIVESACARILFAQTQHGVAFNEEKAVALVAKLSARREEITAELRRMIPPWYAPAGKPVTPKRNMVSKKYAPGSPQYKNVAAGCAYTPVELVEFNPGSTQQIADRLTKLYGWEPQAFTKGGLPQVTDEVLEDLTFPPCRLLTEYQQVQKILGFVSEGRNAWLLKTKKDAFGVPRIHGRVNACGAVTQRMSHAEPNLGQTPSVEKPYGKECREMFEASYGRVLVGADASGLQLRVLAHYLAKYDGGVFAKVVEEDGDVHTYMQTETGMIVRKNKKTSNYAYLFGAGAYKLGTIFIFDRVNARDLGLYDGEIPPLSQAATLGNRVKRALIAKLRMQQMVEDLKAAATRGYLVSLDGRRVPVLSQHKALNALCMAGEAVIMKHALVRVVKRLTPDARMVLNVHDEWQVECLPGTAELNGKRMVEAIVETGEAFGLRCKLGAEYRVGNNWAETH